MAAHVAAPGVGGDPGKPPPDRRQPAPLWRKAAVVAAAVVFLSTLAWVSVVELPDRIDDGRAKLAASECEATASVLMGYANMLVSTTRMFAQGWVGAFDEGSAGWRSVVFPASAAEAAGPRHKALAAAPHATMTSNFILSGIDSGINVTKNRTQIQSVEREMIQKMVYCERCFLSSQ